MKKRILALVLALSSIAGLASAVQVTSTSQALPSASDLTPGHRWG